MRQEIDEKSNLKGELRLGDRECRNQPRQESPGLLDHEAKRARMSLLIGFGLISASERRRIAETGAERPTVARQK